MFNGTNAVIRIDFDGGESAFFYCENRDCENDNFYIVYSYWHLSEQGWKLIKKINDNIAAYCPECAKQVGKEK